MNKLFEINRPVIFAHRGACAHAPENTLASFCLAIEHQADAIELDAKLTVDGEIVVIHDQTTERTTGFTGQVRKLTLAEIRGLDAGSHFGEKWRGEKVPTLAEVFETIGRKLFINVELTNYASQLDDLPVKAAKLVQKMGLEEWVMFSSFNPLNLVRTRQILPDTPVGMLALEGKLGTAARNWLGIAAAPKVVHPYLMDATGEYIAEQHQRGRRVNVWTVNHPEDLKRLFAQDVDGIFTDDPMLARQILRDHHV